LALHHVYDLRTKTGLYRAIRDTLSPGGVLVDLDATVTEDAGLNGLVFERMAARMGDHGITDAEARDHFAGWAEEDRYFPLEAELNALREAGFDEVECFWRRGLCAVTCGCAAADSASDSAVVGRTDGKDWLGTTVNVSSRPTIRSLRVLLGQPMEEICQGIGVLEHREMSTRDLDRLDAQELGRHEALPRGLEDLISRRVHEHGWDIGMTGQRIVRVDRRERAKAFCHGTGRSVRQAAVEHLNGRLRVPDTGPVVAVRREWDALAEHGRRARWRCERTEPRAQVHEQGAGASNRDEWRVCRA
jgi:hypothetical protein